VYKIIRIHGNFALLKYHKILIRKTTLYMDILLEKLFVLFMQIFQKFIPNYISPDNIFENTDFFVLCEIYNHIVICRYSRTILQGVIRYQYILFRNIRLSIYAREYTRCEKKVLEFKHIFQM